MHSRRDQVNSDAWLSIIPMPAAGKMYIQDKVEEYADEVFDLLDKGVSLLLPSVHAFITYYLLCSNELHRSLLLVGLPVTPYWGDVARISHYL